MQAEEYRDYIALSTGGIWETSYYTSIHMYNKILFLPQTFYIIRRYVKPTWCMSLANLAFM